MTNNTLKEISDHILSAKKVYIFPHVSMDCDALGSGVALTLGLRSLGIEAYIIIEDAIGKNIEFIDNGYCINYLDVTRMADTVICVDCSDESRFPLRKYLFDHGGTKICLDHHQTAEAKYEYNYVDTKAAATGEIIFKLLKEMKVEITKEIGESLFAAINADTGNFQYSNTTKETHLIAAELADCDVDYNKVSVAFYENVSLERIKLQSMILSDLTIFAGGKGAIGQVTNKMLEASGGSVEDSNGVVASIRGIKGVEVAILIREVTDTLTKVSMRSKTNYDVSKIAAKYGGGGHKKAAGCTILNSITEVVKIIEKEVEEGFAE